MTQWLRRFAQITVVRNALALYGEKGLRYILPLITVPYLARVLGTEAWGLVIFAQAIGIYVQMVLEYAFLWSATREVAQNQDDTDKLGNIVAGVLGAKVTLSLAAVFVLAGLQLTVPTLRDAGIFVWLSVYWAIGFAFPPTWFFLGIEKLPRYLAIEIPLRLVATAAIFIFVNAPGDAWRVLVIQGTGGVLTAIIGMLLIYRSVPFIRPSLVSSVSSLREGASLFGWRLSTSLTTMSSPVILGFVAPIQSVGFYGGGDRIFAAIRGLMDPVLTALFPRSSSMARDEPQKLARVASMTALLTGMAGLLAYPFLYLAAPFIVQILLGDGYEAAVTVLRIKGLLLPIVGLFIPLSQQWMIPLGLENQLMRMSVVAGAVHIVSAILLGMQFAHVGAAWASVISNAAFLTIIVVVLSLRKRAPFTVHLSPWPSIGFRKEI